MARLSAGAKLRRTSATVNNAESSRSHAVFLLELAIRTPRPDGSWVEQNPRLVMMDLAGGAQAPCCLPCEQGRASLFCVSLSGTGLPATAALKGRHACCLAVLLPVTSERRAQCSPPPPPAAGSESFDSSANTGETTSINTGLLYLGNVLRELAELGERGGGRGGLVSFNNHNLTRFLEVRPPALGTQCASGRYACFGVSHPCKARGLTCLGRGCTRTHPPNARPCSTRWTRAAAAARWRWW